MVGLKDLGEAAWSIEQVLNLWLRQEQEVTPAILDLLAQTYRVFLAWVDHLKTGQGRAPDASGVRDRWGSLSRDNPLFAAGVPHPRRRGRVRRAAIGACDHW